jgi:predicted nuclease of predicted toxin-antitoxin system
VKILLDHNLDWRIANSLPDHEARTTAEMAWDTLKNGALLTEAEKSSFSVRLTADKGIKNQQRMEGRSIAVVIMRAPNNRLETHLTMIPEVIRALSLIQPGQSVEVFHVDLKP